MKRCEVCKERPQATDDWMCKSCAADYDKQMIDRESAQGMVVWSARRARRFERARQRAEAKKNMEAGYHMGLTVGSHGRKC